MGFGMKMHEFQAIGKCLYQAEFEVAVYPNEPLGSLKVLTWALIMNEKNSYWSFIAWKVVISLKSEQF